MLGLPEQTSLKKQIPKTMIYKNFDKTLQGQRKTSFDNDISRIYIVNEISTNTINIRESKDINRIFFILIELKSKIYDDKNIETILKIFQQNTIAILSFEGEYQLAVFNIKLIKSAWQKDFELEIKGLDIKNVWDNFIIQIGSIDIKAHTNLEQAIISNIEKEKIKRQIVSLKNKIKRENQAKRKFDLYKEIKELENKLEENYG